MEFSDGVTAAFTMSAFTNGISRTMKLMGTKGEIRGTINDDKSEIEVIDFLKGTHKVLHLQVQGNFGADGGHGGGDFGVMRDFVRLLQQDGKQPGRTSAAISVWADTS